MSAGSIEAQTFLDALAAVLRQAGEYNKNDQVPPAAVLWPDKDRQWQLLLPLLRERLPLLTLGDYKPEERSGSAYWLRCMLARVLPEDVIPLDDIPIIYLPGVSKQELRAVESCPPTLQPLAELQYRGVLWTQINGKDWTVTAFLQTMNGGLGIEVSADNATRQALLRALRKLADEPVTRLRADAPLRAAFFDALLNPDEVRSLLLWLNNPENYQKTCTREEWAAFCATCTSRYKFHPEQDGPVTAAGLLGHRKGRWANVWQRFAEAPTSYLRLPELLRKARPPQGELLLDQVDTPWPQDNEMVEGRLREALLALRNTLPNEARLEITRLEAEYGARRDSVWAKLGHAPLAVALHHLSVLVQHSAHVLSIGSAERIAGAYTEWGWQVDAAMLDALAAVDRSESVKAVKAAIVAIYLPWLEQTTTFFQQAVDLDDPQSYRVSQPIEGEVGTCILFIDALRMDVAQKLAKLLRSDDLHASIEWRLAALPPVTPTAKPAISPIARQLTGGSGFDTVITSTGARVNVENLRKKLEAAGYQVLRGDDLGDPAGKAWTEQGAIDTYGHKHGWKVAHHLQGELYDLHARIKTLLNRGWKRVVIVTDHGWLLLPDGLPKAELPEHLTELRKGRCARLKQGARVDIQTGPWHWNGDVRLALAPGIHCFEAGKEYEHGGLSPQECVVPVMTVRTETNTGVPTTIENVKWIGLRCRVQLSGIQAGTQVDIRTKPADAHTTVVAAPKAPGMDGLVALVVADDEYEGTSAVIVVLDTNGRILAQRSTVIGG